MNQITVWSADAGVFGTQVRFNAGEAVDASVYRDAREGVLFYEGDLDKILESKTEVFCYNRDYLARYFYFSAEEALAAAKEARPAWVEEYGNTVRTCYIGPAEYKPVTLPTETILEAGNKGLFCKMNLRPDVFGTRTRGKVYFPDRSCKDNVFQGPFVVTEVIERTSFGFVKGHMQQYQAPTDEQIAGYVIENELYGSIFRFCSNKFGTFVMVNSSCLIRKDGKMQECDIRLDKYDSNVSVIRKVSGENLACQVYQGCSFDALLCRYSPFKWSVRGSTENIRFISHLFDAAQDLGILALRTVHNVEFVQVYDNNLKYAFDKFSRKELAELLEKVSEINNKANMAIESKVKNGKLRIPTTR